MAIARAPWSWRRSAGDNGHVPPTTDPAAQVASALGGLDPATRALLDLSVRQNLTDDELASFGGTDLDSVGSRRAAALELVTRGLDLTPEEELEHVRRGLEE